MGQTGSAASKLSSPVDATRILTCGATVIAIFTTAYLSLTGWALANWGRQQQLWRWARWAWSLGCLAILGHLLLAFHLLHHWDQGIAYDAVARQTYEQVGVDWGGGLYINYAFCSLWILDAGYWWLAPARYQKRSPWLDAIV